MGDPLDVQLFQRFCDIAYSKAGITLHQGKEALVTARVAKRLRALGLSSPAEYLELLERDISGSEIISFLDVISTNFTSFFREPSHLEYLDEFVRACVSQGRRRIRIWCAASSTGEEPYTLAISVAEAVGDTGVDWRILATDISTRVLEQAKRGVYDESALDTVPRPLLARYFVPAPRAESGRGSRQVCSELRQHVVFKRLNLAQPPYPMPGPLDVVFCRNVMIYFDDRVRQGVISEIDRLLSDDGLVCIGHSESLSNLKTRLLLVEPSVFQLPWTALPVSSRRSSRRHRSREV